MATVDAINVKFGANTRELDSALKRVRTGLNRMAKVAATAAAGAAAALGTLTAASMKSIDAQAKFADRIGASTEGLRSLQVAASELSGVANGQVNMALQRMTRRISEAAAGSGEAQDAIKELGLDARELNLLEPTEAFARISDAMQGVENQSDRLRISFKLFDSEGAALVNTLNAGSVALGDYEQLTSDLNVAVSRLDAAKIEAANDAFGQTKLVFEGIGNTLAIEIAPLLKTISDRFVDAARESGGFADAIQDGMDRAATAVAFVADAVQGLRVVVKGVEVAFRSAAALIVTSWAEIAKAITTVIDNTAIPAINALIDAYNQIPFVGGDAERVADLGESSGLAALVGTAAELRDRASEATAELHELATQPMPSDQVRAWADAAKDALAEVEEGMASVGTGGTLSRIATPDVERRDGAGSFSELMEQIQRETEDESEALSQTISGALVRGVREGSDGMLDALSRALQQMAAEILQSQISSALASQFGGGGGGAGGLFMKIGSALGAAFGGGAAGGGYSGSSSVGSINLAASNFGQRAGGGPVDGGRTYLVGEQGPELLRMGSRGGTVIPNAVSEGGGGINYAPTVNINGGATEQDRMLMRAELQNQKAEISNLLRRRRF